MQAPKKKTSTSRRDMRRSHHALSPKFMSECPTCREPIRSHTICLSCGHYRGRSVISELSKDSKSAE